MFVVGGLGAMWIGWWWKDGDEGVPGADGFLVVVFDMQRRVSSMVMSGEKMERLM